jgi:Stage II sporulation protein E (SpoIIE)/GAF domain
MCFFSESPVNAPVTRPDHPELQRLRTDADYMHFLVAAGELLGSSLDYRNTLKNVCAAAVEAVADICVLDLGSTSDAEAVGAAHRDKARSSELSEVAEHLISEPGRPLHPVCKVIDSGQPVLVPHIDKEWIERNASNKQHAEFMRRMKYRSMIIVPVRSQIWGVTGALTLVRTDLTPRPYDEGAIAFALDLGRRCGIAIGKARLHSQTIDIAERLQRAALPGHLPDVPELRFDVLYEPADAALLVGGDWYDVFELKDGNIGISIGDVCGHGIESAAQMSSIRNAIRMAIVMEHDLSKVLEDADFLFHHEVQGETFCTALVAIFDRRSGKLTFASAGHPGPLIWTRGSVTSPLTDPSPPLGTGRLSSKAVRPQRFKLEPGCTVLLYTDGIVEWLRDPVAGEAALRQALSDTSIRNAPSPARAIRNACVRGAHADDIALLVIRYESND